MHETISPNLDSILEMRPCKHHYAQTKVNNTDPSGGSFEVRVSLSLGKHGEYLIAKIIKRLPEPADVVSPMKP